MAFALFRGHKDHIAHELRTRANHRHVALENVKEFREFVEASAAQELAVRSKAHIVREQLTAGILLVCHSAELDEPEDFFIFAGARLRKERIALHFVGAHHR